MKNDAAVYAGDGDMLFWEPERWRAAQRERLIAHVRHAAKSGLYREFDFSDVTSPYKTVDEILPRLPQTTKDQLAGAGASAWCVPPQDAREWVCTSGTLGRTLDVPLSARDLERLARNEAAALSLAGVRPGDLLLLGVGMDRLFVAGLAYWLGGQKLGASCVRIGPRIAMPGVLEEIHARLAAPGRRVFVVTVPSFLLGPQPDRQLQSLNLAGIIGIGEALRNPNLLPNALACRITERFGCRVLSTYASTETCTTFAEGPACTGGHLPPSLVCVEILDEVGREVPPGTPGEVVITPLGVEAMPLLRFGTGDIAALFTEPCPCGRTTPRLGPIVGRKQHLLKIRGTSIYPEAIIEALRGVPEIADCAVVAERNELGGDRVTVFVYLNAGGPLSGPPIAQRLAGLLRVTPEVRVVGKETLAELQIGGESRKALRFIDRRSGNAVTN